MDIESIVKQTECNTIGIEGKKHDPNFCTRCQLESYATSQREMRKGLEKLLGKWRVFVRGVMENEGILPVGDDFVYCDAVRHCAAELSAILEGKG